MELASGYALISKTLTSAKTLEETPGSSVTTSETAPKFGSRRAILKKKTPASGSCHKKGRSPHSVPVRYVKWETPPSVTVTTSPPMFALPTNVYYAASAAAVSSSSVAAASAVAVSATAASPATASSAVPISPEKTNPFRRFFSASLFFDDDDDDDDDDERDIFLPLRFVVHVSVHLAFSVYLLSFK